MLHYVYILLCADGTHYVGLTHNILARVASHGDGRAYSTKFRRPIKLVWCSIFPTKRVAARFEQYLKSHSGRAFLHKHLVSKSLLGEAPQGEDKPR